MQTGIAMLECRPCPGAGLTQMILDAQQLSNAEMYKILIGSVAPRPIAWAGTRSKEGINNLAPFSFYNCFSSNPPIVGFSTLPRLDGRRKDTLQNVHDTRCFTLSCASFSLVKQMSKSSALLEPEEDEFVYAGLTPAEALHINAPYVSEALLVFECALHDIISFGSQPGAGNLILGEIKHIHVADDVYVNGHIDIDKLDPVGRLAGNWYSTVRDRFELQRG
jgi:flavin reductase (DIM6/NTAB) family NADH-FMN oxidoreductase RutF